MNPVANKIVDHLSENKIKRTTLLDRLKNAIRAFLGKPIQSISLGIDIKRCDECEYKGGAGQREHLMTVMGARAAYMDCDGTIDIPEGLEAEGTLVWFIRKTVEQYIRCHDVNFDEYIETALIDEYGVQSPHELYEAYKREWCESRGYDPEGMDETVGINGECYACFDEWYVNEYAMLMEV